MQQEEYWCHQCSRTVEIPTSTSIMACPMCGGEFVEKLESSEQLNSSEIDDPRLFQSIFTPFGAGGVENDAFASFPDQPLFNMLRSIMSAGVSSNTSDPSSQQQNNSSSADDEQERSGQSRPRFTLRTFQTRFPGDLHNGTGQSATFTFGTVGGMEDGGSLNGNTESLDFSRLLQAIFANAYGIPGEGAAVDPLLGQMFGMVGNPGDYVTSQQALDRILSQLMEQTAGKNAPPPASEDLIAKLPRETISIGELDLQPDCPVCRDDFKLGDPMIHLPCKHFFHEICIKEWLKINGTCPVCRQPLT